VRSAARPTAGRLIGCLAYHQRLLADARRNRAIARALAARVRPGADVLDLGSGSGVWAVAAARLGARRVVAVEREAVLVPLIEALARENGVGDRVHVVRADARSLRLPASERFDLVVAELVGNEAFDEGLLPVVARARDRFLRPGGALLPERLALAAAPVAAPHPLGLRPRVVASRSFEELALHAPRALEPDRLRPLAPARVVLRQDLRAARPGEPLPVGRARFRVKDGRAVGGLAVWVDISLAPGVVLSTRSGTHWLPTLLPVAALPRGPGRLDVEVDWNPARRSWRVAWLGDDARRHETAGSPLFAWGALAPRLSLTGLSRRD
jgi:SAM-dependent methyltransferase